MKKVTYAKLHTNVFIPGIGDLTTTLPPSNKTFELEMSFDGESLTVDVKNRGKVTKAVIPSANIQIMVVDSAPLPNCLTPVA